MKYNELNWGTMEAIVNKLGGMEGVNDFLSGKIELIRKEPKWTEKEGRIYFEVTTLGLTVQEWKNRLIKAGHEINDYANDVLSKPDYDKKHRYPAGQTLKVVLIRGKEIQKDSERLTKNLKAIAIKDFRETSVSELKGELSLLIREKFSNEELEEMDLFYITVLHQPIIDSNVVPLVLNSLRFDGKSWVSAYSGYPDFNWYGDGAFAFLQVSTQN